MGWGDVGWSDVVGVKLVIVESVGVIRWCEVVGVKSVGVKSVIMNRMV